MKSGCISQLYNPALTLLSTAKFQVVESGRVGLPKLQPDPVNLQVYWVVIFVMDTAQLIEYYPHT